MLTFLDTTKMFLNLTLELKFPVAMVGFKLVPLDQLLGCGHSTLSVHTHIHTESQKLFQSVNLNNRLKRAFYHSLSPSLMIIEM